MKGKRGRKQSSSSSCFDFDEVDPDELPQQLSREPKMKHAKRSAVPEPTVQEQEENAGTALKSVIITKQAKGGRSKHSKVNRSRASSIPSSVFDLTETRDSTVAAHLNAGLVHRTVSCVVRLFNNAGSQVLQYKILPLVPTTTAVSCQASTLMALLLRGGYAVAPS